MTYKFSYQKILNVRQIQEDQKSSEVASAQSELDVEKDQLSELEKEKSSTLSQKENVNENTLDLLRKNSFVNQANDNIDKQKKKIKEKEQNLSSKKDELLEASKSRKIMDKLKETDLEKFKLEQSRKDQNQLDEIGANIALKKRRNNS